MSIPSTALLVAALVISSCNESAKTETETADTPTVDSVRLSVERGKYLATHVSMCIDCHSERDFNKFAGPVISGTEGKGGERFGPEMGVPGILFAKNITPAGIGDWTDAELIRAITRGITKTGDTIFPLMPYFSYSRMAEQGIKDIVAYIRTLKPIKNDSIPARKLFIPMTAALPQLPPDNLHQNVKPDPSDRVKYGQYMFTSAACSDCHTPMVKGAYDFSRMAAGGNAFDMPGFKVITSNITPDSTTGNGAWTEQMYLDNFRTNSQSDALSKNPGKLNTVMPWGYYGKMKEDDLKAIYAFLRTIQPMKNKIVVWPKQ